MPTATASRLLLNANRGCITQQLYTSVVLAPVNGIRAGELGRYLSAKTNQELGRLCDTILRRAPSMAEAKSIDSAIINLRCTDVSCFGAGSWKFDFERKAVLQVYCPWRIVTAAGIALGDRDHEQKFGLPKPVDAKEEAQRLLNAKAIKLTIRAKTADLLIEFENGSPLEIFNSSSGYEGWECSGKDGLLVVAQGGGAFATWNVDPPLV